MLRHVDRDAVTQSYVDLVRRVGCNGARVRSPRGHRHWILSAHSGLVLVV
jgi:hypothetical protein